MLFKIKMESDKDLNLEVEPIGTTVIIDACVKIASWLVDHKDEIISLIKKGWTSPQKIVDYLKQKYHK